MVVKRFVEEYKLKYNKEPIFFSAFAYDSASVLFSVIKQNGTTNEQILAGLNNQARIDGVLGQTELLPNRNAVYPLRIMQMRGGSLVAVN